MKNTLTENQDTQFETAQLNSETVNEIIWKKKEVSNLMTCIQRPLNSYLMWILMQFWINLNNPKTNINK